MNFFEHQDRARRRTGRLIVLFVISVILIVAAVNVAALFIARLTGSGFGDYEILLISTLVTLLIIVGGSLYKITALSGGGPAVAQMLGGRPLQITVGRDDEAMLQNIVEEMSIASGVPMPRVYVLDNEDGINAFAAGFTTNDAVIGVTRGTLNKLNRDELQGVIAHEFSHILHGDMRLNLQIIGVIHGILVVSLIGAILLNSIRLLRFSGSSRRRDSDNEAGIMGLICVLMLLGLALYAIGSIGVLFGRLIQAAVSRQREFLADASAVQFTRNPAGLSGALKKIGFTSLRFGSGSMVHSPHAMETAHLFFGSAVRFSFSQLFSTHPPLDQRIKAIDPAWDGRFVPVSDMEKLVEPPRPPGYVTIPGQQKIPLAAANVIQSAGDITPAHLAFAAGVMASIPDAIALAAAQPFSARAVAMGLLLSSNHEVRAKQLQIIRTSTESECFDLVLRFAQPIAALGDGAKLPMLDLALPALRQLSPAQTQRFQSIINVMIQTDGRVTLFEYTMSRILQKQLTPTQLDRGEPTAYYAVSAVRDDVAVLLSALATASTAQTERAFQSGARLLDPDAPPAFVQVDGLAALDRALQNLARSSSAVKKRLIDAAAHTVAVDGEVNLTEAEMLRAAAAVLDVPLPPLLPPQ